MADKDNSKAKMQKKAPTGVSIGMASLRNMAVEINTDILEKAQNDGVHKNPMENGRKEPDTINADIPTGKDVERFMGHLKYMSEHRAEDVKYTMQIRGSIRDLLDKMKLIPEFRGFTQCEILGAALKVFIENNKKELDAKFGMNGKTL